MTVAEKLAELFRNTSPATSAADLREAERLAAGLKPDDPARGYVEGLRMVASLPRRGGPPAVPRPPAPPPPPLRK